MPLERELSPAEEDGQPEENPPPHRLAVDQTVLANERTWLAWLRTGLAILAGGLAVARFMRTTLPDWTALLISSLLVGLSVAMFMLASWRYASIHLRMAQLDIDAMSSRAAHAISGFLALCALIALTGLWIMALNG